MERISMKYHWLNDYLLSKKGAQKDFKAEWNWERYMIRDKLFCAVCLDDSGNPVYITLKLEPARGDALRQLYPDILPGYYMNKVHWNSVKPDGEVPDDLLRQMLDESYSLILASFSKKKQMEILEERI